MKKRYARILAATLSAAMVFTSAPVDFTGIDLGVIEAKAAEQMTTAYTASTLKKALEDALEVEAVKATLTATYNGTVTTGNDSSDAGSMAKALKDALQDQSKSGILGAAANGAMPTATVTVTDGGSNAGTYAATVALAVTDSGEINSGNVNITFKINKAVADAAHVGAPNKLYYYKGESVIYGATGKNANDQIGGANFADWTVNAADLATLKAMKPADEAIDVRISKVFTDAGNYDYSDIEHKVINAASVEITKTYSVKVSKAAYTGSMFDENHYPSVATVEFGTEKITLTDGSSATADEKKLWKAELAESMKGKKVDAGAAGKVKVTVYAPFDADNYELVDADSNASNGWETSEGFKYNAATGCYEKEYTATITAHTLDIKDIEWPTALAEDTTISYGDTIANIKLAETATSKYGTFNLKKDATLTVDEAGNVAFDIVFTRNATNTTKGAVYGTLNWAGDNITVTCPDKITFPVGKNVIKTKTIKPTLNDTVDYASFKYGATVKDVVDSLVYPTGKTSADYTIVGAKATDRLAIGKNTITLEYKVASGDAAGTKLENGETSMQFTFDATVTTPTVKLNANKNSVPLLASKGGTPVAAQALVAEVQAYDGKTKNTTLTTIIKDNTTVKYQWYANGAALRGETTNSLTPDTKFNDITSYKCAVTVEVKASASASVKALLSQILAASYESDVIEYVVSGTQLNITGPASNPKYGYTKEKVSAIITAESGATVNSVSWYIVDGDDVKTPIAADAVTVNTSKTASSILLPEGLEVGAYKVFCEVDATNAAGEKDICRTSATVTIDKAALSDDYQDPAKFTFPNGQELTYGDSLTKIEFKAPKDAEKYGTYKWVEKTIGAKATTATLRFVPSATTLKNYEWTTKRDGATDKKIKAYEDITIPGFEVAQAVLTIKPQDVTIEVGSTLPAVSTVAAAATGLVGADTLEDLDVLVSFKYDKEKTADVSKAGTIADAVIPTVNVIVNGVPTELTATNKAKLLDDYKIEVANGSVIVKAKADVAPSVKPTPAPVKQATAAAPKAAKAKATVKVGKKYTLKVKFAAGKKSTVKKVKWTSSKKSVATVSSKGKVTAKKAGKATIYARVYFKDGSMKKIKFTVTVK